MGAILYDLLTGRPPFEAESLTKLLQQVVVAEPVSPRLLNPGIPRDLETIALKCLEKEPHRRYHTAQELAEDLGRFLDDKPIQARPVGTLGKAWKWSRRRPALASMGAALVVTFVLGLAGVLWEWHRARDNERFARQNVYAADMKLAQNALDHHDIGLAVGLLDKHRPQGKFKVQSSKSKVDSPALSTIHYQPSTDLRGWEWRYLWQLCQGDEWFTLHSYTNPITALALSREGTVVAVGTGDGVALWDVGTRSQLTALPRGAKTLAFSPTNNLLAVGTWDAKGQPAVDLWEVNAGQATKKLRLDAGNRALAFSPDGKRLATLDHRGKLKIAESASGRILYEFAVQPLRYGGAGAVVFVPDADHLAVGEDYGGLRLLDLKTGTFLALETRTVSTIDALAFSPATGLLAAGFGSGEGGIRLWDARSWEPRGHWTNHTHDVSALAFSADGQYLASASRDRTIRIRNVADQVELRCLQSAREGLTALAWLLDGRTLVSGGSAGSLCFWDRTANHAPTHTNLAVSLGIRLMREIPPAGFAPETLDPRTACRFGLAFTRDSRRFLMLDSAVALGRWNASTFEFLESLPALGSNHWGLALSPDEHWLATGDHPGSITFWDWTTRQAVTNFAIPFEWFGLLRFSHSGHYVMATSARNSHAHHVVRIWRTGDWLKVPLTGSQFEGLFPVDLSPDDRLLAVGYLNGALKLFRFPSLEHVATLTQGGTIVFAVLFSPDGRELVSVDFNGLVRRWDVMARREQTAPLRGHLGLIMGAALSPDGRRLATGGTDARDAVKLWDLAAHREILSLPGEGIFFTDLAFSPDGQTLAATAMSGTANLWRAPSWEEIEAAEKGKAAP